MFRSPFEAPENTFRGPGGPLCRPNSTTPDGSLPDSAPSERTSFQATVAGLGETATWVTFTLGQTSDLPPEMVNHSSIRQPLQAAWRRAWEFAADRSSQRQRKLGDEGPGNATLRWYSRVPLW